MISTPTSKDDTDEGDEHVDRMTSTPTGKDKHRLGMATGV